MEVYIIKIEKPFPPRVLVRAASGPLELFKSLEVLYPLGIQQCSWSLARDIPPDYRRSLPRQEVDG